MVSEAISRNGQKNAKNIRENFYSYTLGLEYIINNLFANGMFGGKAHIFHMGGPIPSNFAQSISKPAPIITLGNNQIIGFDIEIEYDFVFENLQLSF